MPRALDTPLAPGGTIGILGGGQLGRMLVMAAARLGFSCHIYSDKDEAPAGRVAQAWTRAPFDDADALDRFARAVDMVTFEFENVPASALARIEKSVSVAPPIAALEVSQDRLREKELARTLGIGTADFATIESEADMTGALERIGRPALLKTRRFGYDGKGQVKIDSDTDPIAALAALRGAPSILEQFVPFEREISILAVRGWDGGLAFYDPAENRHADQILRETRIPARITGELAGRATAIAEAIASALDYVGVLCVELFAVADGCAGPGLLVNEIAPRVHNSGHWTLEACAISQFENHIRAVAGWPLGATTRHSDAIMTNLIGNDAADWRRLAGEPGLALHLYGKGDPRPGRKMGHITRLSAKSQA